MDFLLPTVALGPNGDDGGEESNNEPETDFSPFDAGGVDNRPESSSLLTADTTAAGGGEATGLATVEDADAEVEPVEVDRMGLRSGSIIVGAAGAAAGVTATGAAMVALALSFSVAVTLCTFS